MNLNQLEVLSSLVETGSTVATADELALSQSGVSRILKQLEAEVGFELFERSKGRLIVTADAVNLAAEASKVLSGLQSFAANVRRMRRNEQSTSVVKIGLPSSMAERLAPSILVAFRKDFPSVRIETVFDGAPQLLATAQARKADLVFVPHAQGGIAGFDIHPVLTCPYVCVFQRGHPLETANFVTLKNLARHSLITVTSFHNSKTKLDQTLERTGLSSKIVIETTTNSSACAYAESGLGVALVSKLYAALYAEKRVGSRLLLPGVDQSYGLAYLSDNPLLPPTRGLIKVISSQIQAVVSRNNGDTN